MKPSLSNSAHLTIRKDAVRKDGSQALLLRLKISGNKKDVTLGEYCPLEFWDEKNQKVKKGWPEAERINTILESKLSRAKEIIFDYKIKHRILTIDEFSEEFGLTNSKSFLDFIQSEIQVEKELKSKASGTLSNYLKDLSKLKRFRKEIYFAELTETFLRSYEIYMKNELKNNKNTINRSMRFLRNFNNRAISKGLTESYPFKKYKLSTEKTLPRFLDQKELEALQKYFDELTPGHKHHKTLLPYLFCCYTGLRYSDISQLRFKDIHEDHIYFKTQKTKEPVRVPLISIAKKLIGFTKHSDLPVFKVPCNQTTNRCLKDIADVLGINKTLTFHTSRHTFATVGLNLGIDITVIRDLLGHTDLKQTQLYAKLVEKTRSSEMKKWEGIFNH